MLLQERSVGANQVQRLLHQQAVETTHLRSTKGLLINLKATKGMIKSADNLKFTDWDWVSLFCFHSCAHPPESHGTAPRMR